MEKYKKLAFSACIEANMKQISESDRFALEEMGIAMSLDGVIPWTLLLREITRWEK